MANEDVQKTLSELSRELQESNARLAEAQRVAHVGHWEWDLETGVVVWSDETYRIFGLSPQERPMDLATVRAMVHPESRESLSRRGPAPFARSAPTLNFGSFAPAGVRTVHSLTSGDGTHYLAAERPMGRAYKLFGPFKTLLSASAQRKPFRRFRASC
jgi:PAS domain-containing protein